MSPYRESPYVRITLRKRYLPLRVKNYLDYIASNAISRGNATDTNGNGIVVGMNDRETVERVSASLHDMLSSKPYLVDMLRLAFLSSLLIESQMNDTLAGFSDVEIRQHVLSQIMDRARASHNRPSNADSYYYHALASIASTAEPNDEGFFHDIPILDDRAYSVGKR